MRGTKNCGVLTITIEAVQLEDGYWYRRDGLGRPCGRLSEEVMHAICKPPRFVKRLSPEWNSATIRLKRQVHANHSLQPKDEWDRRSRNWAMTTKRKRKGESKNVVRTSHEWRGWSSNDAERIGDMQRRVRRLNDPWTRWAENRACNSAQRLKRAETKREGDC